MRNSSFCNNVTILSISGLSDTTDMTVVALFEASSGAVVAIVFGSCGRLGFVCRWILVRELQQKRNLRHNLIIQREYCSKDSSR